MKKVTVVGNDPSYVKMFLDYGFEHTTDYDEADLICFTGGEDVDPSEYGHEKHPYTYSNPARDAREIDIYNAYDETPAVGICRGGQLLNVLCGGTLYQDVDKHGVSHFADDYEGNEIRVSSTHHQMMIPASDGEILLSTHRSTYREAWTNAGFKDPHPNMPDVECVYYDEVKTFCFQPHPEYFEAGHECTDWFFKEINKRFFNED